MNIYEMMPCVVKETSNGFIKTAIADEMFKEREIECVGAITDELVYSLILQLRYLQLDNPNEEIVIHINSPGGEVTSGLALYDVMKAISCPIRTICEGMAASMAAIIFLSGDEREILQHGRVMLHDPLINGNVGGSALELERISKELLKTREIIAEIISEHTGKTKEEVYKITVSDTYFDAEESINWGLADRIVTVSTKKNRKGKWKNEE